MIYQRGMLVFVVLVAAERPRCATSATPPANRRHKERFVASFTQQKGVRRHHPGRDRSGPNRSVVEHGHRINPLPEARPTASFPLTAPPTL
jgi:hypothetical protein